MAYSSGGLIAATDYNTLATSLKNVLDVGTGNKGWGQDVSAIGAVSAAATVTATQWSNLISKSNLALAHQGQTLVTPASVTAGNNITYYATITNGITTVNNTASGVTGLSLSDSSATNASYTGAWGNSGNRGLIFTHTVTFASGNAARYFFNAGGRIKLSFSRSGGSSHTRNTDWTALATACGSFQIGSVSCYKVGGSGSTNVLNTTGYWGLTGSDQRYFKQFDAASPYTTDYIAVDVQWSGTAQNGGSPVLTIKTYWINTYSNPNQQTVDGTATTALVVASPGTTYLTNTWGTPTVGQSSSTY